MSSTYTIEPVPVPFESLYMPESQRALCAAIHLARACNAEIGTVSTPVSAVIAAPTEAKGKDTA